MSERQRASLVKHNNGRVLGILYSSCALPEPVNGVEKRVRVENLP
jgi:hypothetical protein